MVCMYDEIDDRESDKIEKEETKKGAGKMVERTKVNNNVSSLKIGKKCLPIPHLRTLQQSR